MAEGDSVLPQVCDLPIAKRGVFQDDVVAATLRSLMDMLAIQVLATWQRNWLKTQSQLVVETPASCM